MESNLLLPASPYRALDEYIARGGGHAVTVARERGAEWVFDALDRAGLRGRGGAGFPSGRKWRSVAAGGPSLGDRYVVANGAEGEPGTFKDRPLLRANPYQVLEGLAIAATAIGAREAFVCVKASFSAEVEALERALHEMAAAGLLGDAPVTLVGGPEEYLFGEEKAMLEVIEGNDPTPRWLPPYVHGLFATTPQEGWSAGVVPSDVDATRTGSNPTLVTNVESLANVPLIVTRGADWYRGIGTSQTTGPLICTVVGDVVHAGYGEVEPGTPLRTVIDRIGGGPREGRHVKAVLSGVSNPVLTEANLDAPVSYEGLEAAGGGLGSAGFIVYDDTRNMAAVARMVSRFLYVESCGQCRACKFGCGEITRHLDALAEAHGTTLDVEIIGQRLNDVTNQNRCYVGTEEQRVISSLLRHFPGDFTSELESADALDPLPVPKISVTAWRRTTTRRPGSSPTGPTCPQRCNEATHSLLTRPPRSTSQSASPPLRPDEARLLMSQMHAHIARHGAVTDAVAQLGVQSLARSPMRRVPAKAGVGTAPQQVGTELPDDICGTPPMVDRSFAFLDLCGFTAFMDEHGVHHAQRHLRTLREQIREVASRRAVSVAKWLGDGAMVVGPSIGPTLAAANELAARYRDEPMALRGGVAHGQVLVFDGDDYVGQPANLAARLCGAARPGEVLAVGYPAALLPHWVRVVRTRDITLRGIGRFRHIQSLAAVNELELGLLDVSAGAEP